MFATLFASLFVQGILLGLAALALLAAAPRLQKRYGPQWLCRLWVTLAVLLLVPLHALVPQAPAAVSVDTTPLYSRTALSQEVTERPADGVPYMVAMEDGAPTGYIVPRAELQTGHRTVLERLAVGATRLNLLALAWNLGVLAVFGIEKVQWLYTGLFKLAGLFANGPTGNAAQGVAFFAVLTAVEIIISFLLVMRASAKPLPVKGE